MLSENLFSGNQILNRIHLLSFLQEISKVYGNMIYLFWLNLCRLNFLWLFFDNLVETQIFQWWFWIPLFLWRLLHTLLQNFHYVKVLILEVNPFPLQVSVNDFLLLLNWLVLAFNLLEQYLHEVDLAKGKLTHFVHDFCLLSFLQGWLQTLDKTFSRRHGSIVHLLSPCEQPLYLLRVERHQRVLLEAIPLVRFISTTCKNLASMLLMQGKAFGVVLWCVALFVQGVQIVAGSVEQGESWLLLLAWFPIHALAFDLAVFVQLLLCYHYFLKVLDELSQFRLFTTCQIWSSKIAVLINNFAKGIWQKDDIWRRTI